VYNCDNIPSRILTSYASTLNLKVTSGQCTILSCYCLLIIIIARIEEEECLHMHVLLIDSLI
jgi:hypothetical protein